MNETDIEIIEMRYMHDMTIEEIAEALSLPMATVNEVLAHFEDIEDKQIIDSANNINDWNLEVRDGDK